MAHGKRDDIHETPDVSYIHNPDVAHEESDVNVKAIYRFVIGLFILMIISMVLMKLLANVFEEQAAKDEAKNAPTQLAVEGYNQPPPEPRLQLAPSFGVNHPNGQWEDLSYYTKKGENMAPQAEYRTVHEDWEKQLKGGVVNPKTGATTIPIEEAMKETVQQGLPTRQQGQGQTNVTVQGLDLPSDSSGGKATEKRDQ
jgi:hypothetical protein